MRHTILWRGIFFPGHEYAAVYEKDSRWIIEGVAVFMHEDQACRLEYTVECDQMWNTEGARVSGWVGERSIDVELKVDAHHNWYLNGIEQPAVRGCTDADLNFSPSTNLLPIRRLNLEVGQEAPLSAAWLRFPSFKLERLDQIYRRVDQTTYRYESGGGTFAAELKVNTFGLVTSYPQLWAAERG